MLGKFRKQLRLVIIALYILLNKSEEREKARGSEERERAITEHKITYEKNI